MVMCTILKCVSSIIPNPGCNQALMRASCVMSLAITLFHSPTSLSATVDPKTSSGPDNLSLFFSCFGQHHIQNNIIPDAWKAAPVFTSYKGRDSAVHRNYLALEISEGSWKVGKWPFKGISSNSFQAKAQWKLEMLLWKHMQRAALFMDLSTACDTVDLQILCHTLQDTL